MTAIAQGEWKILGAGAIGCLWAAALHKAGRSPLLLLRDEAASERYRRAQGLLLNEDGQQSQFPVAAMTTAQWQQPLDLLLVTTKAQQCLPALEPLISYFTSQTTLVLMHNGMGVHEVLMRRCPQITLYLASTTEGAYRRKPFEIVHAGHGQTLLGRPGAAADTALRHCAASLSCSGLSVTATDHIEPVLWRKLAVNAVINPLTALYRCYNGDLAEQRNARVLIRKLCAEVATLSERLNRSDWLQDLEATVLDVATATAANRSSMLQDVEAGRDTEIDYINGYLCHLADQQGLQLPLNRELTRLLKSDHTTFDPDKL